MLQTDNTQCIHIYVFVIEVANKLFEQQANLSKKNISRG